jgi:hypothetical protein
MSAARSGGGALGSGSVRNVLTGLTSDARNEEIQLCIHTPLSDVSLDL